MPHYTKINAIFVDIKAGYCSIPVHIVFIFPSKYSKIVT